MWLRAARGRHRLARGAGGGRSEGTAASRLVGWPATWRVIRWAPSSQRCPPGPPSPSRPPRRSPPHAPRCRRRFRLRPHGRRPNPPPFAGNAARESRGSTGRRRLDGALAGRRRRRRLRVGVDARRWTIGLVSRETATKASGPVPGVWYLELQRRPSSNGRIVGVALDVGPDMALAGIRGPFDFMGAAVLVGGTHRFGRTFVEATAGLGLEAYQFTSTVTTESISPEPASTRSTTRLSRRSLSGFTSGHKRPAAWRYRSPSTCWQASGDILAPWVDRTPSSAPPSG